MKKLFICLFLLFAFLHLVQGQDVVINELMQSNVNVLYVDNEFPDSWIELYNTTNKSINLKGYAVGDSEKYSKAYVLPENVLIPSFGHLVIYCDKEEYGLHTDFRVESGKGSLYLFDSKGEIIDQVSFAKMPSPDVAYGRSSDNADEWGYMVTPTPGAANIGGITSTILPLPIFSEVGGLKNEPIQLSVTLPDEELPTDVVLCVTLDGKEPELCDEVSAPYVISIDTTTIVRAKLFSNEAVSTLSQTHSYIYYNQLSETPLPVISIVTNHDYLYDPEWGILGIPMENGLNADVEWRRPINIEYFTDGEAVFNQVGETRVQGSWSRRFAQRSLAVYANKRFGTKRFEAQMWKDKPNVDKFKSFTLRNGGNDFVSSRVRDAFAQTLIGRHCDNINWMAYQPCICFINGVYKGIYDIRERSNEDFIEANYDGLEEIDMIENWHELKAGSETALNELFAAINNPDVTFEEIESLVDIDELINHLVYNSFITNTDYPFNNHIIWRDITKENPKWEFVMKDLDRTVYEDEDFDYFNFLYQYYDSFKDKSYNLASGIKLYCLLLENEKLRNLFIDRYIAYMGDFIHEDVAMALLQDMKTEIDAEYYNHCMVYFEDPDAQMEAWNWHFRNIKLWWGKRREFMTTFLADYLELGCVVPVTINTEGCAVTLNNIRLTQEHFMGAFYSGHKMTLVANDVDCDYGWLITKRYSDGSWEKRFTKTDQIDILAEENMESISVEINFKGALDDNTIEPTTVIVDESGITLRASQLLQRVALYDMQGRIVSDENVINKMSHTISVHQCGVYMMQVYYADGLTEVKKVLVR